MRTAHLGRRKEQELVFFNHNGWKCSPTFVFLIRELDTKGCKSLIVCTLVLLGGIQRHDNDYDEDNDTANDDVASSRPPKKRAKRFMKSTQASAANAVVTSNANDDRPRQESLDALSEVFINNHTFQHKVKAPSFVSFSYGSVWFSCLTGDAEALRKALVRLFLPNLPPPPPPPPPSHSLYMSLLQCDGLWFFPFLFKSGRTLIDIVPFNRSRFTGVVMRTL